MTAAPAAVIIAAFLREKLDGGADMTGVHIDSASYIATAISNDEEVWDALRLNPNRASLALQELAHDPKTALELGLSFEDRGFYGNREMWNIKRTL